MTIFTSLGYVVVTGPADEWERFATDKLGAAADRTDSGSIRIRLDDRAYRIVVEDGPAQGPQSLTALGFTVADGAMDRLKAELKAAGVEFRTDDDARRQRGVRGELVRFADPDGNVIEAVTDIPAATEPFESPADVQFVTGDLGVGHVFMTGAGDPVELSNWYRDVLGFKLTDTIALTALQSDDDAVFLHCNPRHHSIAVARSPILPPGLGHIMLEVTDFRTLGRMMTHAQETAGDIVITLGEHSNDRMTSFYITTPSGFDIEYGCNGLLVDDEVWVPGHYEALSNWGHTFVGQLN
ncbi:VOC family protein [Gordonia terrae]|uniref:VOC family protein n=1 Tax=Gordonia terrae TaxID=2055 RepID=UPI003F6ABF01